MYLPPRRHGDVPIVVVVALACAAVACSSPSPGGGGVVQPPLPDTAGFVDTAADSNTPVDAGNADTGAPDAEAPDAGLQDSGPTCIDPCESEGGARCTVDNSATETCEDSNKDGCLDWGAKSACGATETCSGGFCADTCKDECTTKGATKCDATGALTCDDYYYSTYAQVVLTETTWGYKYTVALKCQKEATQKFNWSREIVPGTYKIEVYGTSNYANFPFTGTQVIVPQILLK